MVFPNQSSSIFGKKNQNSLYKGSEGERRTPPPERINGDFREQATDLLSNSAASKSALSAVRAENGSEGLHKLSLSGATDQKQTGITETVAATLGGDHSAIKGMNADGDQVNQMINLAPTAELFQEMKEQDVDQALNFAARNPEFQRQALHEMDDESFQQEARLRFSGTDQ